MYKKYTNNVYIDTEVDRMPRHPVHRIYIARKVWHHHTHHQRGLFPNPGMSSVTRLSWRSIFPCTNLTQWSNTVDDSDMTSIIIKLYQIIKTQKNLNVHKQSPHGGIWKTFRTLRFRRLADLILVIQSPTGSASLKLTSVEPWEPQKNLSGKTDKIGTAFKMIQNLV